MNPIRWLLRDDDLNRRERELDEHIDRLKERVMKDGSGMLLEVDTDFPEQFTELSEKIASGNIEWRDFYCNEVLDIYSVHCRMNKGSMLKEHRHPKFDEYIYVISGSIINWMDSDSEGKVITPVEKAERKDNDNVRGWYRIPSGANHRLQAMKDNTHFISKFIC